MIVGGAPFAIVLPFDQCVVPPMIEGPVALFVTSDGQPLNNNVRDQATDKLVAGPTMAFIDVSLEVLGQLARSSGSPTATGSSVSTTETLTPAEASAVLSSAGVPEATATDAAAPSSATPASSVNAASSGTGAITVNGWSSAPASA